MAEVGEYDDKMNPICMPLDLDTLADQIVYANYGTHRMLSALIRARKRQGIVGENRLFEEIERLLEEGES